MPPATYNHDRRLHSCSAGYERSIGMKGIIFGAMASALASLAMAQAAVVGGFGQPGYYGRIDIGSYPPPVLVNAQPIMVGPVTPGLVNEPMYLHVPPDQIRNWPQHCHWYGACGSPVYFVQDIWYQQVYVPRYREMHDINRGRREWNGGGGGFNTPGFGRGRHGDGWNN
jgi:hypothetical protein